MDGDSSRNPDIPGGPSASNGRGDEDIESNLFRIDGESLFVGLGAVCDTAARLTGVDGVAWLAPMASRSARMPRPFSPPSTASLVST